MDKDTYYINIKDTQVSSSSYAEGGERDEPVLRASKE